MTEETDNLYWPTIAGDEQLFAQILEDKGYVAEYSGRSGFARRNSYVIKTKDGMLSPEAVENVRQGIQQAKQELAKKKSKEFDEYFDKESVDENKTYAVVLTGYNYYLAREPDDKYIAIASDVISFTRDYRRGFDHTSMTLMINKDRMAADKRQFITLRVPKKLMGMVIGKGGKNIKELQERFGKRFAVKQDLAEQLNEKKDAVREQFEQLLKEGGVIGVAANMDLTLKSRGDFSEKDKEGLRQFFKERIEQYEKMQEEQRIREREEGLRKLTAAVQKSFGDKFIDMNAQDIRTGVMQYLSSHEDELPLLPTDEETKGMIATLKEESERQRKWREWEKQCQKEKISNEVRDYAQRVEAESGQMITFEKIHQFFEDNYADNVLAAEVLRQEEEKLTQRMEQAKRKEEGNKIFDKVLEEEFDRFLSSKKDTGGHMGDFFNIVGKDRRYSGYATITDRALKRAGLYNDLIETEGNLEFHKQEWSDYLNKAQDLGQRRQEAEMEAWERSVVQNVSDMAEEDDGLNDYSEELHAETKEERVAAIKAAKRAYAEKKGTNKKAIKLGGLAALAALKNKDGQGL